ncbi:hypothetical protein BTO05_11690 [Winogradskyella sp. PC-19]|jgi:hypothetical protein|uniref:hypothetical protein n=1 Tax=unclassified Winogradskyella TaxID=2615021 RepID=UPI000B3D1EDA|nr:MULTISPECIES: hypothetical protein [unclassified Winogradskyella]ARV10267.1 hypothetical protein BTO05_11690 [Winogradskyella sp. PC-19]RZN77972.1 MAG: hypothetical protein EVB12_05705 [Winogradskyella sp.]
MRKVGTYMAIAGLLLIVLPFFGLTLRLLGWIDELGETAAWAIKIGLIVVGAVLFFLDKPTEEENSDTIEEPAE